MGLPEITKKKVEKTLGAFCERRVPPHVRDKIQLKFFFRGDSVTLFEERPRWDDPKEKTQLNVAQFRFDEATAKWSLYCRDRNSKWHLYQGIKQGASLDYLIDEVDKDPTGIFWG